ncbi:hypothetical protein AAMO2058_001486000 [Amorphochlora amoebiformis]
MVEPIQNIPGPPVPSTLHPHPIPYLFLLVVTLLIVIPSKSPKKVPKLREGVRSWRARVGLHRAMLLRGGIGEEGGEEGGGGGNGRPDIDLGNAPHLYVKSIVNVGKVRGDEDGVASSAQILGPRGIAVSPTGEIFFADRNNQKIRKITTDGICLTVAGNSVPGLVDGPLSVAQFWYPIGGGPSVCAYEKWPRFDLPFSGYWDGPASFAKFFYPYGLACDHQGNTFVADSQNFRIRKIDFNGNVTTLAGSGKGDDNDGPASIASFFAPNPIAVNSKGIVFVADPSGGQFPTKHKLRRISPNGEVTTFAGSAYTYGKRDGMGTKAKFWGINGLSIDKYDNIYACESLNQKIRRITPKGEVTTLAGRDYIDLLTKFSDRDGPATAADLFMPYDIAVNPEGTRCYFTEPDEDMVKIRVIYPKLYRDSPFLPKTPLSNWANFSREFVATGGRMSVDGPARILGVQPGRGRGGRRGDGGRFSYGM